MADCVTATSLDSAVATSKSAPAAAEWACVDGLDLWAHDEPGDDDSGYGQPGADDEHPAHIAGLLRTPRVGDFDGLAITAGIQFGIVFHSA